MNRNLSRYRLISLLLALMMMTALPQMAFADTASAQQNINIIVFEQQIQPVETEIDRLSSRSSGSVYLKLTPDEFAEAGYLAGDMVEVTIEGREPVVLPFSGTASLGYHEEGLRSSRSFGTTSDTLSLSLTAERANGLAAGMKVTIAMQEQGAYLDVIRARDIGRMTYDRKDYPDQTDEEFANFREVTTTGMGKGILYRSSNPVNPMIGRNKESDALNRKAGVTTFINLSDKPESVTGYEGYDQSYYSTVNHIEVNMGGEYSSDDSKAKLVAGLRFMIDNPGVYEVNCIFGRDRTGFVIAVLEGLMGATYDEICSDYVETYKNYNPEYMNYEPIEKRDRIMAESNIVPELEYAYGVADLKTADIKLASEAYLRNAGMTDEEIRTLQYLLAPAEDQQYTVDGNTYRIIKGATASEKGTAAFIKAANTKDVTVPAEVVMKGRTYKVVQIAAQAFTGTKIRSVTAGENINTIARNAFYGSKATKLTVKTKSLTKITVMGSLNGSKVSTVLVRVGKTCDNVKYAVKYKKIFTKHNAGKIVIVR